MQRMVKLQNISAMSPSSRFPGNNTSASVDVIYPVGSVRELNGSNGESDFLLRNASIPEALTSLIVSSTVTPKGTGNYTDHIENGEGLYQVPLWMVIFLCMLYGGISVSALVGNTLVLWVVSVSRRMRTVTNMFIANLALADIIIGLFAIPFQFQAALLQRWNLPEFMCAFCPFVQVLSVNVSVFTLSTIAVDRYRAVLYPLSARVSKKKATWAILSIWAVGFLLALPPALDYKVTYIEDNEGGQKPFCTNLGLPDSFRLFYHQSIVVVQYFFPLIIITGAYAHMGAKLWGSTAPGNREESRDAVVLRNKKKVIKMLALVVLMFALCWLPLQTYNFLQFFIPSINTYKYINVLWFSFHSLAMSNSCCNPFIYAIYNDKFQREFRSRLRCLRMCRKASDEEVSSDISGIDRSKIRATYRFTNNPLGSATSISCYNNTTCGTRTGASSRSSVYNVSSLDECQGVRGYMGVGTHSFPSSHIKQHAHTVRHHRHHRRYHRHRHAHCSDGGVNSNLSHSYSSCSGSSHTSEMVAELECTTRHVGGEMIRDGPRIFHGSTYTLETDDEHYQETSFTVPLPCKSNCNRNHK